MDLWAEVSYVTRTTVVPYTSDQMFALVNDVESYPRFLPWCVGAEIEGAVKNQLIATVTLSWGGIRQSVTTRNTLQPSRRITMDLVRGPFKQLTGCWQFDEVAGNCCRVCLELHFEFKNRILKLALDKAFEHIMYSSVDAFNNRATQIYGKR